MKIILLLAVIISMASCNIEKETMKSRILHLEDIAVSKSDSLRVLVLENSELKMRLQESTWGEVKFDTAKTWNSPWIRLADTTWNNRIDSAHWINQINRLQRDLQATQNRVRFFADGSFEAQGQISSFRVETQRLLQQVQTMRRQVDSLQAGWAAERKNLKTEIRTEYRTVEKTVFPWYFWLALPIPLLLWIWFVELKKNDWRKKLDPNQ